MKFLSRAAEQGSSTHPGSSSLLVNTRGSSARHAGDQLEVDLLEAPQTPATLLSRSSGLAPQPARLPASPKVTMSRDPLPIWGVKPARAVCTRSKGHHGGLSGNTASHV